MSNNLQDDFFDSHIALPDISSISLSKLQNEEESSQSSSSTCNPLTEARIANLPSSFLCTICFEEGDSIWQRTLIPGCEHTFCLPCLLSWTQVSNHCPLCKSSFSSVFVHRDLQGNKTIGPLTFNGEPAWILESVALLRRATWVSLQEVHSSKHDIEHSFQLPNDFTSDRARPSAAPQYANEEYEDELEDAFWEEEQHTYDQLMNTMHVPRRIGNRRFGPGGYIASGHLRASPRPLQTTPKSHSGPSASSSQTAKQHKKLKNTNTQSAGSSSKSGRKKKVKKKSRAGIAAAQAAAAAKEANQAASADNISERQIDQRTIAASSSNCGGIVSLTQQDASNSSDSLQGSPE